MLLQCHKTVSSLLLGTAIGVAVFQRICFCHMVPSVCDLTQLIMNQVTTTDLCTCFVTVHELSMLYHKVLRCRRIAKLCVKTILSAFFLVKFQKPMHASSEAAVFLYLISSWLYLFVSAVLAFGLSSIPLSPVFVPFVFVGSNRMPPSLPFARLNKIILYKFFR